MSDDDVKPAPRLPSPNLEEVESVSGVWDMFDREVGVTVHIDRANNKVRLDFSPKTDHERHNIEFDIKSLNATDGFFERKLEESTEEMEISTNITYYRLEELEGKTWGEGRTRERLGPTHTVLGTFFYLNKFQLKAK